MVETLRQDLRRPARSLARTPGFAATAIATLAIGVGISSAVSRMLDALLFGVRPLDPLTLAAVAIMLCAVAALACGLPARRAARVDPVVALRAE